MRKKLLGLVFAVSLLVGTAVPLVGVGDTAFAGGRAGLPNGQSDRSNVFGVCHQGEPLWLPNQNALDAHLAHGDPLVDDTVGGCADN